MPEMIGTHGFQWADQPYRCARYVAVDVDGLLFFTERRRPAARRRAIPPAVPPRDAA